MTDQYFILQDFLDSRLDFVDFRSLLPISMISGGFTRPRFGELSTDYFSHTAIQITGLDPVHYIAISVFARRGLGTHPV